MGITTMKRHVPVLMRGLETIEQGVMRPSVQLVSENAAIAEKRQTLNDDDFGCFSVIGFDQYQR